MRWRGQVLAAALLASGLARADDARQNVQGALHEALLRYATLPSTPARLPDRDTVLPGSAPRMLPGPRPTPPRGSPAHEPGGPRIPNGMHDGRGALAAHGPRDGSAMRDGMRASMAHEAQSRTMMQGARDANAMRGQASHRSSMGFGMGAMPGTTGQQGGWVGNWGCEDGAGMWRTMNPNGGTMRDNGMGGWRLTSPTTGGGSTPGVSR